MKEYVTCNIGETMWVNKQEYSHSSVSPGDPDLLLDPNCAYQRMKSKQFWLLTHFDS